MAPCTWPISYSSCGSCAALDGMSPEDRAAVEEAAVEYLWNWTLRVFGVCPVVVRPCRSECAGRPSTFWGYGPYGSGGMADPYGPWPNPQLVDGLWTNVSCGFCAGACSCDGDRLRTLALPGPVTAVSEVLVDGVVLDPSAYRVDNRSLLVRLDGGVWPVCQDMTLPPSEVGTFRISYSRGAEVPVGGQVAAGVLACELAKAWCRDATCALPQRVQTVTRQGVTVAMIDNGEGIEKGQTGIWIIDSWVSSITNPVRPSTVLSPDVPRSRWRAGA